MTENGAGLTVLSPWHADLSVKSLRHLQTGSRIGLEPGVAQLVMAHSVSSFGEEGA